jgi:hypothetical protein
MTTMASRYRMVPWQDLADADREVPRALAIAWIGSWLADPEHRGEVLEALQALSPAHRFSKGWMDDRELGAFVRPRLLRALDTGEMVLVERAQIHGWKPMLQEPDDVEEKVKTKETSAPTKTWIEFLVVDEDDNPVEGVRYEARLTNESKKTGTTGATGLVRFDGLDAGICEFTLLDVDTADVESAAESRLEPLDMELVDDDGQPVANTRFFVKLQDGKEREFKTDSQGFGHLDGLEVGDYEVRFPNLEVSR